MKSSKKKPTLATKEELESLSIDELFKHYQGVELVVKDGVKIVINLPSDTEKFKLVDLVLDAQYQYLARLGEIS